MMKTHEIGFVVDDGCELPIKAHENDMGYDVQSREDIVIPPKSFLPVKVKTGLRVDLPPGLGIQIQSRSGLAFNKGIRVFNGIIDSGYTGEIIIGLYNESCEEYRVCKGDRIAQLCFYNVPLIKLKKIEECVKSERGEKGFGSSGLISTAPIPEIILVDDDGVPTVKKFKN